jgi:glycosyltransferase involved in cell wall biosynthesis
VVAGLLLRKKTVFTAHGWPFQERRSKLATMFIWLLSWLTGLLSHRVIVPSANDFRLAKKMPLIGRKTRLVYLGRDIKFCNREESRVHIAGLVKKEVSVNIPWICVLAELHANKGHRFLIEAAKSIPAQLFFVGGGEIGAQLKNQARGLGVLDKIFFLGHIDDAATYLPAFDCMVLPSLKEGLPYTLIEAGLAGIPALASNVGGIPEIIVNQAMLFESGSAQEMRISVNKFLQLSRDDCRVIRSEFQAHVQERFSKQRMIVETLRVYQEVL